MTAGRKVLVIGDDTRSFLATVRSLGRRGVEVHAAPFDLRSPALRSRYIRAIHRLPYYLDGGDAWVVAMRALIREHGFALVIPCEERGLLPLYRHREAFDPACRLAIPDEKALAAFFDKYATRELAQAAGVPVPPGRLLTATETAQTLAADFSFPLVLKYRRSYAWPDLYVRKAAFVIDSSEELERWLLAHHAEPDQVYVEQFFPGLGGGVSVLCDKGTVIQAFEHQRAHELVGSSYYRRSTALDRARLDAVVAMVERVAYTGLAMFEYKLNTGSGAWRLLEVNARPWGSLPLPVALGVDFPYFLFRLLVQGEALPPVRYREGVYGRNLVPDLWQLRAIVAKSRGALIAAAGHVLSWLGEFGRIFLGREHQDVWVRDDVRPAIVELAQFARDRLASMRVMRALQTVRFAVKQERKLLALARASGNPLNILFLCQGNICRSPYAALRLSQKVSADAGLTVTSAGLLPRNSRPSPAAAQAVAARRGVDLTSHMSSHAHPHMMAAATVIVLFDDINFASLLGRYPEYRERAVFLGGFDPSGTGREIADPDGRDEAVFESTYAQIDRCVDRVANLMRRAG